MLKPRRLQRILHHIRHLDNPLLQPVRAIALLSRCVTNELGLALAVGYVFGLSGFDLAVDEFLECETGLFGCGLDVLFRRTVHSARFFGEVFTVRERNEVFELGLDVFSLTLALVSDGIVANISFAVDLESEGVTR